MDKREWMVLVLLVLLAGFVAAGNVLSRTDLLTYRIATSCQYEQTRDTQCSANQWCSARLNTCQPQRGDGDDCNRKGVDVDRICQSGLTCSDGKCRKTCDNDENCDTQQYCSTYCRLKLGAGDSCTTNSQCKSNSCVNICIGDCNENSDCDSDKFCVTETKTCVNKIEDGAGCSEDFICKSGYCDNSICTSRVTLIAIEICDNGMDDNSDGKVDGADPRCQFYFLNLFDGLIDFGVEDCTDGDDNDGDDTNRLSCNQIKSLCLSGLGCNENICMSTCNPSDTDCRIRCGSLATTCESSCNTDYETCIKGGTDCEDEDCDMIDHAAGQKCEYGTEITCTDQFDNDADGKLDCADSDCDLDPFCTSNVIVKTGGGRGSAATCAHTTGAVACGTQQQCLGVQLQSSDGLWHYDIAGCKRLCTDYTASNAVRAVCSQTTYDLIKEGGNVRSDPSAPSLICDKNNGTDACGVNMCLGIKIYGVLLFDPLGCSKLCSDYTTPKPVYSVCDNSFDSSTKLFKEGGSPTGTCKLIDGNTLCSDIGRCSGVEKYTSTGWLTATDVGCNTPCSQITGNEPLRVKCEASTALIKRSGVANPALCVKKNGTDACGNKVCLGIEVLKPNGWENDPANCKYPCLSYTFPEQVRAVCEQQTNWALVKERGYNPGNSAPYCVAASGNAACFAGTKCDKIEVYNNSDIWVYNHANCNDNCTDYTYPGPVRAVCAETNCSDNKDNDHNGPKDCADISCDKIDRCEYNKELSCNDGFDNDADTKTDCADPDCNRQPCGTDSICSAGTCVPKATPGAAPGQTKSISTLPYARIFKYKYDFLSQSGDCRQICKPKKSFFGEGIGTKCTCVSVKP